MKATKPVPPPSIKYGELTVLHDLEDENFFKTHTIRAVPYPKFVVILATPGKTAARELVKAGPNTAVYYRRRPRRKPNGGYVVDLRRKNLLIKSIRAEGVPGQNTHPHWLPAAGDTPSRSNVQYATLFERWREGDASALDEIVWATQPLVKGFVNKFNTVDRPDAESDLNQALLRSASLWLPGPGSRCWIEFCKNYLRMFTSRMLRKLRRDLPLTLNGTLESEHISTDGQDYISNKTPEALIVTPAEPTQELGELVDRYIGKLSPREQRIVRDIFLEGVTYAEAARKDGRTRQRVNQVALAALTRLRAFMLRDGVRLGDYLGS